jgi:hypothetical protein
MKTTLSIIAAALVSGAAYGQDLAIEAYKDRMNGDFRSTAILNQLEEIQAAQRRSEYCPLPDQLQVLEERRIERQRETYLRHYLEDCE